MPIGLISSLFARFGISVLLLVVLGLASQRVHAQGADSGGTDASIFVGQILPNQIDGVGEILPVVGGRFAFGLGPGSVETGLSNSTASGIDFTTLTASYRGEFAVDPDVSALVYAGADLHWYKRQNTTDRVLDYGFHFGTGALLSLTQSLGLRGEMKFNAGPGTSLSFLFGVALRF